MPLVHLEYHHPVYNRRDSSCAQVETDKAMGKVCMNGDDRKLSSRRDIALRCKDVVGANKVTNEVGQHEKLVTGGKAFVDLREEVDMIFNDTFKKVL